MKNQFLRIILPVMLLFCLCGCGMAVRPTEPAEPAPSAAGAETEPGMLADIAPTVPATIPPDGDPDDVTCRGSYTDSVDSSRTVATVGTAKLSLGQLQSAYWACVAQYRQENHPVSPDFDLPLDSQSCDLDVGVASWQQYFLKLALQRWHTAQVLLQHSTEDKIEFETEFQPNPDKYAQYLVDIPATRYMPGYSEYYRINTLHETYLEELPDLLADRARELGYPDTEAMAQACFGCGAKDLLAFAEDYNAGYMYFTFLSYDLRVIDEEIAEQYPKESLSASDEDCITIRHLLLAPGSAAQGDGKVLVDIAACEARAEALEQEFRLKTQHREADFAELANKNSCDTATALDGGLYKNLRRSQLPAALADWCFDAQRTAGDMTSITLDDGVHMLYFSGKTTLGYLAAEDTLRQAEACKLLTKLTEGSPMSVDYSAIRLSEAVPKVSLSDLLYPDVAHERYPEVPIYLQQDYPKTKFGGYRITTNGCGITSMSMLATYMADEPLTPPVMCARYGIYSYENGTDGTIFNKEPQALGFYLQSKTYEPPLAKEALEQGHIVISIQHAGYWTRGGHYIVLEKIDENGVQVRDSNLYNYNNSYRPAQNGHLVDRHTWSSITASGSGYWIFDYKVTHRPACSRCGDITQTEGSLLLSDYQCPKCREALNRRIPYLTFSY